jgi:hypothetical protein
MATEYRLSLTKTGAALSAQWVLDGAATTPLPIAPKLTPEDLAEHRWYLEEYIRFPGAGDHARARAFEERLEAFGQDLYGALRHDGYRIGVTLRGTRRGDVGRCRRSTVGDQGRAQGSAAQA